ncbi:hypothetical protein Slip_0207 [Syntrophothermus lipocalidus DSM 12680]|uniref:Nuclease SbcCD subunit C n=2 Tax=Syntrophothermus TaxID=129001 RepID=D7CJA9_SYNLT|nr:hypothetical protein Slip_0207 [Syntrophothermus lipocalidus DSM 12680]
MVLDTDADVVLLTGPNGFGKTSLIDSLCLLLNGHYYRERHPMVSYVGVANSSGDARVEAVVEYAGSEFGSKVVTVCDNSKGVSDISSADGFCPYGISPELAARCSFYYQDLLSRLFEEEDPQVPRLLEFLRPLPEEVSTVQESLKKARVQWKDFVTRELKKVSDIEGLASESAINEERKRAAIAFRDSWQELANICQTQGGITLPRREGDWLFLIKSDNLRSGWERELRNLAADCLALFLTEKRRPAANEKPSVSLGLIEESLNALRLNVINRTGRVEEKLRSLLEDLPDDTALLPPRAWPIEERYIAVASQEIQELQAQVSVLESLERHFDNPAGPNLQTVLVTLRDKSTEWLKVPDVGADFSPPSPVIEWLRQAASSDLTELADQFEKWLARVAARRLELVQRVSDLQKATRHRKELLEKSRQIYDLLQDPRLKSQFEALAGGGSPLFVSMLKTVLQGTDVPNNLLTAIERVRKAVLQWKEIEDLDERRKVALHQKTIYLKAKGLTESVTQALEQEVGRNSVLNTAILPPDEVIKDLEGIVNHVLKCFRLVDGIWPVRFGVKRERSRKSGSFLGVCAADGRPLSAFSTGQKAQLGLAMLLGFNYCLNSYIGHNIIALDDVTTAFDMAQLPRTAALIRQIAYATDDASARRQVFIVSHHEDLTNRLLDFLIPPQGKKMRILNFVNWTRDKGPQIEQREVVPGLKASAENRKKFVDALDFICSGN